MDVKASMIMVVTTAALKLSTAQADGLDLLPFAVSGGTPNVDLQVRYEAVKLDPVYGPGVTEDKAESTLARLRLGYTTGKWNNFDAQAELETVSKIGSDQYQSTDNLQATYPTIADPAGGEVNQAWLRYSGLPKTAIKIGRQRVIYDNARFIGNVGWRLNEQTYDGATISSTFIDRTTINLAHLTNANAFRAFRFDPAKAGAPCDAVFACKDDLDMKAQLVNIAFTPFQDAALMSVRAYLYQLDFEFDSASRRDTQTLGLRLLGTVPYQALKLSYVAEYADQQDYADSPKTVDADYRLLELGLAYSTLTVKIGDEVLSGDGAYSFQTPLGTVHAHDGWADLFLTTPAIGLERLYANLSFVHKKATLTGVVHKFNSDKGGEKFGQELDLLATYQLTDQLSFSGKYAKYYGDYAGAAPALASLKSDTTKGWAYVEYKF